MTGDQYGMPARATLGMEAGAYGGEGGQDTLPSLDIWESRTIEAFSNMDMPNWAT